MDLCGLDMPARKADALIATLLERRPPDHRDSAHRTRNREGRR
jgi:hypothetical protein